ncbi:MAG: lipopolysaccharide biosynthesis protein [Verrucomicrobia bacterium]|nr:lipopolysaccharide biosynthesis protein [Verrucomicrobiota bacterium]
MGTEPPNQGHERQLTRAVAWSALSNWTSESITALVTLILAALLKPADFGLVAMAMVYVAFLEMVLGFGLNAAIIRKKDLTPSHLSSIFWLIVGASAVLVGLSIGLSGYWAAWSKMPELKLVVIALSAGIPIQGLTTVQQAVLQRRMDFRRLAIRNNGALISGALVGIALALSGFGVWALVFQTLTKELVALILLWTVGDWRPQLTFSTAHARELLGFSSKVFLANLAHFVQSQSDALMLGLFYGPAAVGVYRLSDRLVAMALKLLTRSVHVVALPYFSRFQDDKVKFRAAVLSCWRKSSLVTMPAMCFLCAASDQILRLIGPQWSLAGDVLKLLSLVGMARSVSLFTAPALQAAGRPGLQACQAWVLALATTLSFAVVGMLTRNADSYWQVVLMAASRAGVFILIFLPVNFALLRLVSGVKGKDLFAATWPSMLTGLTIFVSVRLLALWLPHTHVPLTVQLVLEGIVAAGVGGGCLLAVDDEARTAATSALRWARARLPANLRSEALQQEAAAQATKHRV